MRARLRWTKGMCRYTRRVKHFGIACPHFCDGARAQLVLEDQD